MSKVIDTHTPITDLIKRVSDEIMTSIERFDRDLHQSCYLLTSGARNRPNHIILEAWCEALRLEAWAPHVMREHIQNA